MHRAWVRGARPQTGWLAAHSWRRAAERVSWQSRLAPATSSPALGVASSSASTTASSRGSAMLTGSLSLSDMATA
eukprot:358859-Chlamydomonas_euryale.AAC.6